jgi:serine phosphatase RsbU (regulator of sigma subunit)/pSer/pThr/pTyr-binding forkhead associated (FHA) protein
MASLHVLRGANEGTLIPLEGDRFVLGRNPDCAIVIPITSVSREHAQIVRVQGRFFIEDNKSRNGTYLNDKAVTARTPLKNNDKIRICDFVAAFLDKEAQPDDQMEDSTSTIEAVVTQSSHQLLETQPAEKLRHLLEISSNLSKTLDLETLLPQIAESLFSLFRQADRCFIIQAEEGTRRLLPRVVKTRRPQDESTARPSRTIVQRCLETAQAYLSDDASKDAALQMSQSVVDFRIRSVMCVPLCDAGGKAFGVIQLDTQDRSKRFTAEDLRLLYGVANQAAIALDNARLHAEAVQRERLHRDLELAHRVQLSFLPARLPQVDGYDFFAHYEPANEVGGDYYGFIPLPDGRLAVAVGDVAGKGVAASLLMAKLSSDARFSLLTEPDLGKATGRLNDLLYEFTSPMDRFVTFAGVLLDPARNAATLVNAGHLSPLLFRKADGSLADAVPSATSGVPLGIMDGMTFDTCEVELAPGDCLLMYSDGVPDALNVREEQFGLKAVEQEAQAAGAGGVSSLGERLVKAVRAHAAGRSPHDDITLVCLGRNA